MRLLLLAATLLMTTPGWARTSNPEMVDWAEYHAMTSPHQQAYLTAVAAALGEFEAAQAEVFAADTFASYPYFRELFAGAIELALPELQAQAPNKPIDCLNTSFVVRKNSKPGDFCAEINNEYTCANASGRDQTMFPRVDGIISQCPQRFLKFPEAVAAYKQYAELHPEMAPKNLKTVADTVMGANSIDAQKTQGVPSAMVPNAGRSDDSVAAGKLNKGCSGVSRAERLKARQAWRADKTAACLNGGEISSYSAGPKSPCSPKDNGKCNAKNTYSSAGQQKSFAAGRRTLCLNELYCQANKDPICVEASGGAFKNCQTAVDKNATKLKFGKECVGNDMNRYKAVMKNVAQICDHELARSLLCNDCKALKEKLDLTQSQNSSGNPAAPAAAPAAAPGAGTGSHQ